MKILLIDVDSKGDFPNLALMKISAYHKSLGDTVKLQRTINIYPQLKNPDLVYMSCIFFQTKDQVNRYIDFYFKNTKYIIGGSGYDLKIKLPEHIENIIPDYDLYRTYYGIGFSSRGCIRNCKFCIVQEKEGKIKEHHSIQQLTDNRFHRLVLLDNNFQASKKCYEKLKYIIENKIKVNFNQGLDFRLFDDKFLSYLQQVKYYDFKFVKRSFYIALDNIKDIELFEEKIKLVLKYIKNPKHIMVYILVGFNSTYQEDIERINTVLFYNMIPYIMLYNQNLDHNLRHLRRYYNGR